MFKRKQKGLSEKQRLEASLTDKVIREEVARKRSVAKDKLYPYLLENSLNIEDAKQLCTIISVTMRQAFENRMKDIWVSDLGLDKMIDPANPEAKRVGGFIKLFADEKLNSAFEIIDGMTRVIDSFIKEENTKRPLKELKATFL